MLIPDLQSGSLIHFSSLTMSDAEQVLSKMSE